MVVNMRISCLCIIILVSVCGCRTLKSVESSIKPLKGCSLHSVKSITLSNQQHIVVTAGRNEPCSIGSYSIRLYGANPKFPFDDFKDGKIRVRDGVIVDVFFNDDVIGNTVAVKFQSAGSSAYNTLDLYKINNNKLIFIRMESLDK